MPKEPHDDQPSVRRKLNSLTGRIPLRNPCRVRAARGSLFGVGAAACHLGSGVGPSSATWGIARTPAKQRIVALLGTVLGITAFVLGAATTVYYASDGPWLGPETFEPPR